MRRYIPKVGDIFNAFTRNKIAQQARDGPLKCVKFTCDHVCAIDQRENKRQFKHGAWNFVKMIEDSNA